jgi:predicted permease
VSHTRESYGDRFYRGLLRLLPFDFRSEFGDEMEEAFREQRDDTSRRAGPMGLWRMWWATITGIVRMAPREHASVLAQDTRFALRMMRKNRAFTLAVVAILGLGVGANTSIFSVVNSVLLRPLPYASGDQLIVLRQFRTRDLNNPMRFSVHEFSDYRERNHTLDQLVEYHSMRFTLLGGTEPHSVRTGVVTYSFFDFLGVKPLLGRAFRSDEEGPGAQPVLILSYEFWRKQERGDPNIIGKKYAMNDRTHIVIGVLPPIPQYPDENDVYMTTSSCPFHARPAFIADRDARMMLTFGRMKAGITLDQARSDLRGIAAQLEQEFPKSYPARLGYTVTPAVLRQELTQEARPLLWTLLGAAAFVLLIACANVANLILSRMAQRERELNIRWAMGAGAGRLMRQLLTESLILALLAAGVGVAFAWGSMELLRSFAAQLTSRAREISLDGWVLGFAAVCAAVTAVVCGSLSALQTRSGIAQAALAQRNRIRSVLIAAQVAFSYVLLIGAGLMARTMMQLERVDPGFTPQRAFAVGFDLNFTRYSNPKDRRLAVRRLLERVQQAPGVMTAAISSNFPMNPATIDSRGTTRFRPFGDNRSEPELPELYVMRAATPDYFRTLGIPLQTGRMFLDSDTEESQPVAVISRTMARAAWGREEPIGRTFTLDDKHWIQVVGVVGDVRELGPAREAPVQVYLPMSQFHAAACVIVRAAGDPEAVIASVRRAVLDANIDTAITRVDTLEDARSEAVRPPRTITRLFLLFAALALVIAVAGIGSMLMLWVRQRIREIGVRMALGASPGDIVAAVLRQGMALAIAGFVLGIGGALALTGLLKKLLFEVTPTDAPTFVAVSLVLLASALFACWVPARRAARIDPQAALRCE